MELIADLLLIGTWTCPYYNPVGGFANIIILLALAEVATGMLLVRPGCLFGTKELAAEDSGILKTWCEDPTDIESWVPEEMAWGKTVLCSIET